MDYNSNLVRALNLITLSLQVCVALALLRQRLYRTVPWFTIYIGYLIAFTYILHRVYNSGDKAAYFYGYWAGNAVTLILAFMVILEVFRNAMVGYESVRKLGVVVLVTMACVTLLIAIMTSAHGSDWGNSTFSQVFMRLVQVTQRGVRMIQLGLLVGLFAFSSYFALSWRNHVFGIALGYGLYASVNLCAVAVVGFVGPKRLGLAYPITIIDGLAFICTLLLWLTYLLRPDRGSLYQTVPPSTAKPDLKHWEEALTDLMKR